MKLRTKFQDEDFELGEVVDANVFYSGDRRGGFNVVAVAKASGLHAFYYHSIKDFTDHWEDYEEPKTYYYVSDCVNIESLTNDNGNTLPEEIWEKGIKRRKQIGNYFETKEEATKAIKKLKAWKRLKDEGFKFTKWQHDVTNQKYIITMEEKDLEEWVVGKKREDLDLLFGGEE